MAASPYLDKGKIPISSVMWSPPRADGGSRTQPSSGGERIRTADLCRAKAILADSATCADVPKPALSRDFVYPVLPVVSRRCAVRDGTETGRRKPKAPLT
jgi:hypothetical protein